MGSIGVIQLFTLLTSSSPPHRLLHLCQFSNRRNPTDQNDNNRRSLSVKAGGRAGGSEWERTQNGRSRYDDDQFDFDEEEFRFRNTRKQRNWWSDDSSSWDEDDDVEEGFLDGLGIFEGSIAFSSIFKVLRAFGWMVPAVVISMLVGTGTNAFALALALPLAQSALSLVFDMLWGRSTGSPRPKSRSQKRKRSFSGASSGSRMREEKGQSSQYRKNSNGYRSWTTNKNVSSEKGERKARNFGGWDELDKQWRTEEEPKIATESEKKGQSNGKLSKRARNRNTPLLVRLLIAFFPFLGFWTKLL